MPALYYKFDATKFRQALSTKVKHKIKGITTDPDIMDAMYENAKNIIEPYVPYKSGMLNASVHQVRSLRRISIVWSVINPKTGYDYAEYQHNTVFRHRTRTVHPKAKSFWTNVIAPGTRGYTTLVNRVSKVVKEKVRNS